MTSKSPLKPLKPGRRSTLILHRTSSRKGHQGFEDLRDVIKCGEEFCKEVSNVLQERAELESSYSRSLQKLSSKLMKASKERSGTISNAWHFVANDFEQEAEIHKTIASAILDEIAKPLKGFLENQHKIRKNIEALVEKRNKQFSEWKNTQSKAKSKSYLSCRENEKVQDQMLDCKLGRGRHLSDKENMKLECKRKKSETSVRKCDMEYYASCIKTERSRLEWEGSILRGSSALQRLEEERLAQLADKAGQYLASMKANRPKLRDLTEQLEEPVLLCDTHRDINTINFQIDQEGMGEQHLPSFYSEDLVSVMNRERRRESLSKFVGIIKADIERERKGRAGVENLAKALQETPKFGGEESQQDVQDKLLHMQAMLTYLEATRFKILNVMMDLEGKQRVNHPMAAYLENIKDKQGMFQSILRIPSWVTPDPQPQPLEWDSAISADEPSPLPGPAQLTWEDRGTADGRVAGWSPTGSPSNRSPQLLTAVGVCPDSSPSFTTTNPIIYQKENSTLDASASVKSLLEASISSRGRGDGGHDFDDLTKHNHADTTVESSPGPDSDFDDFDSNDDETSGRYDDDKPSNSQDNEIQEIYYQEKQQVAVMGQCKVMYDYTANMYDELNIRYGDIINIHDKQEDGWWLGECDGKIGIFPATYVEPI